MFTEFGSEDVSGFLHEFVAVSAAFEDSGFEASWAVGDLAGGDLGQHLRTIAEEFGRAEQAAGELHPGAEDVLAGAGKADVSRLFAMQ